MKKWKIVLWILFGILLFSVVIGAIFIRNVSLDFAETVAVTYQKDGEALHMIITDEEDIQTLKTICEGRALKTFSNPSCGFGGITLSFEGREEICVIYPACDNCDTMRLGEENDYFWNIGTENREKLVALLKKYEVIIPCV